MLSSVLLPLSATAHHLTCTKRPSNGRFTEVLRCLPRQFFCTDPIHDPIQAAREIATRCSSPQIFFIRPNHEGSPTNGNSESSTSRMFLTGSTLQVSGYFLSLKKSSMCVRMSGHVLYIYKCVCQP